MFSDFKFFESPALQPPLPNSPFLNLPTPLPPFPLPTLPLPSSLTPSLRPGPPSYPQKEQEHNGVQITTIPQISSILPLLSNCCPAVPFSATQFQMAKRIAPKEQHVTHSYTTGLYFVHTLILISLPHKTPTLTLIVT